MQKHNDRACTKTTLQEMFEFMGLFILTNFPDFGQKANGTINLGFITTLVSPDQ